MGHVCYGHGIAVLMRFQFNVAPVPNTPASESGSSVDDLAMGQQALSMNRQVQTSTLFFQSNWPSVPFISPMV